ncbi:hypothetical protein B0H11DRAFT_2244170 [Mycena galericulata]|nr:hypothetical protein B0H11DRAFT_2244170 [Mycena galericulata]
MDDHFARAPEHPFVAGNLGLKATFVARAPEHSLVAGNLDLKTTFVSLGYMTKAARLPEDSRVAGNIGLKATFVLLGYMTKARRVINTPRLDPIIECREHAERRRARFCSVCLRDVELARSGRAGVPGAGAAGRAGGGGGRVEEDAVKGGACYVSGVREEWLWRQALVATGERDADWEGGEEDAEKEQERDGDREGCGMELLRALGANISQPGFFPPPDPQVRSTLTAFVDLAEGTVNHVLVVAVYSANANITQIHHSVGEIIKNLYTQYKCRVLRDFLMLAPATEVDALSRNLETMHICITDHCRTTATNPTTAAATLGTSNPIQTSFQVGGRFKALRNHFDSSGFARLSMSRAVWKSLWGV